MLTRDSAVWTVTLIGAILVFLSGQFDLLTHAFPSLGPVWQARIQFFAALLGFISGYLKMSPLPLSPTNTMAGTAKPSQTLLPLIDQPTTRARKVK
jgi:hypothetical protein